MLIRYGFDIDVQFWQSTTFITAMDVHQTERHAIIWETELETSSDVEMQTVFDNEGNRLRRLQGPPGVLGVRLTGIINSPGVLDDAEEGAPAAPVQNLPLETLPYLRGSRYCETDLLSDFAWRTFGSIDGGYAKVKAICDYVHRRLRFSYPQARSTRTAAEAMNEQVGVCRDFTHLAIALCRCLNIPARYCNGYLGDIGVPPDPRAHGLQCLVGSLCRRSMVHV
jgi:transglutaminase-like putative cysteine protease